MFSGALLRKLGMRYAQVAATTTGMARVSNIGLSTTQRRQLRLMHEVPLYYTTRVVKKCIIHGVTWPWFYAQMFHHERRVNVLMTDF